MDTIAEKDVTELVERAGWIPAGLGARRLEVRAALFADYGLDPASDGDWASADDVAAWKRDDWAYVVLQVRVLLDGVELGSDTLGGMVYGTLPASEVRGPIECDPLADAVDVLNVASAAWVDAGEWLAGVRGIELGAPYLVSLTHQGRHRAA